MRKMLKACQKALKRAYREGGRAYPLAIEYPFRANPPRSGKRFRRRLRKVFSRDKVVCGIAGIEKPAAHWLTFVKRNNRLIFFDSAPAGLGGMHPIRLDDLHVRARGKKDIVLNPRELIVFREA